MTKEKKELSEKRKKAKKQVEKIKKSKFVSSPLIVRVHGDSELEAINKKLEKVKEIKLSTLKSRSSLDTQLKNNKFDIFTTTNGCFTHNTDLFTFHFTNRDVTTGSYRTHQNNLLEEIQKYGMFKPILVIRYKNYFIVVDGQNRLIACRRGGIPINFNVVDLPTFLNEEWGLNLDSRVARFVTLQNKNQRSFSTMEELKTKVDFYESCKKEGNEQGIKEFRKYKDVYDYAIKYRKAYNWTYSRIMALVVSGKACYTGKSTRKRLAMGDFEFTKEAKKHIDELGQMYGLLDKQLRLKPVMPLEFLRHNEFIKVVLVMFDHKGYDHQLLLKKLEKTELYLYDAKSSLIQQFFTQVYNDIMVIDNSDKRLKLNFLRPEFDDGTKVRI